MNYLVTREERQALRKLALHWPKERRLAIAQLVCETVDSCPKCGRPVRRCDSRAVEEGRIGHLRCITGRGTAPPADLEPL